MKYHLLSVLFVLGMMSGCHSNDHEGHDHETEESSIHSNSEDHDHDHEHEEGDHDGHDHEAEGHDHEHEGHDHEHEEESSDEITITPEKAAAAGISSAIIKAGDFQGAILCNGKIRSAWSSQQVLTAPTNGIIHLQNNITTGAKVGQGSLVASISGENIIGGDDAEKARITLETAKAEYDRTKALFDEHLATAEAMNLAKEAYLQAQNQARAFTSSSKGGTALKSGVNGYLVSLDVQEGDYVTAGQRIGMVANSNKLILEADLPGRYMGYIGQISSANIRPEYSTAYISGNEIGAKVVSSSQALQNGFFPVTLEMGYHKDLAIGSYCQCYLLTAIRHNIISLPTDAITETQGVYYAYRQIDEECYEKVPVTIGQSNGAQVEILSGISEGERIVTSGAIHVKLAGSSNAIPAHSHSH